jgi:hypothetical protein
MANTKWQITDLANQIGTSIETAESKILKLEEELESMHLFLDFFDVPRWGVTKNGHHGQMTLGERMNEFRKKDSRFERIDSSATV